jgi:hypothetical protein
MRCVVTLIRTPLCAVVSRSGGGSSLVRGSRILGGKKKATEQLSPEKCTRREECTNTGRASGVREGPSQMAWANTGCRRMSRLSVRGRESGNQAGPRSFGWAEVRSRRRTSHRLAAQPHSLSISACRQAGCLRGEQVNARLSGTREYQKYL